MIEDSERDEAVEAVEAMRRNNELCILFVDNIYFLN